MHIWTLEKWKKFYNNDCRTGVRLRFDKSVESEVKRVCEEFCKWLRKEYFFPIRVVIYVKSSYRIKAMDGDLAVGTFFEPFDRKHEPYIRIAAGDYNDLLKKWGRDSALVSYLSTIAHELTHYFQWINDIKLTEIGRERQATAYTEYILDEYRETRDKL